MNSSSIPQPGRRSLIGALGAATVGAAVFATEADAAVPASSASLYVNVKDFGAVGNATTDDTAAIQAAISDALGRSSNNAGAWDVYFPAGRYKISQPLQWAASVHSWLGSGQVTLDFQTLSAGAAAISVAPQAVLEHDPIFYPVRHRLEGFQLLGPATVDGIRIGPAATGTGEKGLAGGVIRRIGFKGFRDQIVSADNNWCWVLERIDFYQFSHAGFNFSNGSNSGENTVIRDCLFHDASIPEGTTITDHAGLIVDTTINGQLSVYSSSFDYMTNIPGIRMRGGSVSLFGCHIEDRLENDQASVSLDGLVNASLTHAAFNMFGGQVYVPKKSDGSLLNKKHVIALTGTDLYNVAVNLVGVHLHIANLTTTTLDNGDFRLVRLTQTGPNPVRASINVSGTTYEAGSGDAMVFADQLNGVVDSTFESVSAGSAPAGAWVVSTPTKLSAAVSTDQARSGTRSLKVAGTGAAGAATVLYRVAARAGQFTTVGFWLKKPAAGSGSIRVEMGHSDALGNPISNNALNMTGTSFNGTTVQDWIWICQRRIAPAGAGFAEIRVVGDGFTGSLYLDDVHVSTN